MNNRNWKRLCKGEVQAKQLEIEFKKERVRYLEKPILFNTEMVKAILEGRKTKTRRVIKKKYSNTDIDFHEDKYGKRLIEIQNDAPKSIVHPDGSKTVHLVACEEIKKPYKVGDILYVRETWMISNPFGDFARDDRTAEYMYKARYTKGKRIPITRENEKNLGVWKPSIHMPKEASRIFLKVTNVRAERLQDITEEQAINEGVGDLFLEYIANCGDEKYKVPMKHETLAIDQFELLWNSTLKKEQLKVYGWNANPWVWVIDFERIERGE